MFINIHVFCVFSDLKTALPHPQLPGSLVHTRAVLCALTKLQAAIMESSPAEAVKSSLREQLKVRKS